jgi:1-acyl-sn-glycerol-3-phosphate acyltransferase
MKTKRTTVPKKAKAASATKPRPRPKAARPAPSTQAKPARDKPVRPPVQAAERPPQDKPEAVPQSDSASRSPSYIAQIRSLEAELDRILDARSEQPEPELELELEVTQALTPEGLEGITATEAPDDYESDLAQTRVVRDLEVPEPPPVSRPIPTERTPDRASASALGQTDTTVFDTARELLSSDFYLRKWGRVAMRGRSEEVDDFGFDPIYEEKARVVLEFLYTRYFRVETTGIERVPAEGRCLLVANHSGTLPLDGVMLKSAVKLEHPQPRDVRWLTEDFINHMPYLGSMMNRLGAVRACQENAERLLNNEHLVAVFPEGVKGIGKLFSERYRLQRFGRGGFIKLCLRTQTPIVPVAVVGAEETNPLLFKIEYLSRALGLPYVPVTPTFPALGPLGLLPAPTKWQIHFGEPLDFTSYGREAADDDLLVGKLAERVRATIQGMLDRAVGSRKSVFFG